MLVEIVSVTVAIWIADLTMPVLKKGISWVVTNWPTS